MTNLDDILSELEELKFNDKRVSQLERAMLTLIENQYGKRDEVYEHILYLSQQGFWRPEKGDPRGSATCFNRYQKEYHEHILQYRNLFEAIKEHHLLLVSK